MSYINKIEFFFFAWTGIPVQIKSTIFTFIIFKCRLSCFLCNCVLFAEKSGSQLIQTAHTRILYNQDINVYVQVLVLLTIFLVRGNCKADMIIIIKS